MSHSVHCTIDFEASGRQVGRLEIPKSTNTSGWAHERVPIAQVANGEGPTALVFGGNHGDEYEGQVAGLKLLRELQPEQIHGRVIVIPCLSPGASRAGTRLWPSGANFNRSFPGRVDGAPDEQLAHFVTTILFPLADYVIDIHSGGTSQAFVPCSHMHVVNNRAQRKAMLEAMLAWGSDYHFLYIAHIAGSGLLPVEADRQGKIVVTTELGGGGFISARVHQLAESGLANVLRHARIVKGDAARRERPGIILDGRDLRNYIYAPESGIFETLVDPGDPVTGGQLVGRIHSLEHPEREPTILDARLDGVTASVRAISRTEQGDNVLVFGQPIEPNALLAEAG